MTVSYHLGNISLAISYSTHLYSLISLQSIFIPPLCSLDIPVLLLGSEIVQYAVVRYSHQPRLEFALVGISPIVHYARNLNQHLLQEVVCYICVFDHHSDIVAQSSRVSLQKL